MATKNRLARVTGAAHEAKAPVEESKNKKGQDGQTAVMVRSHLNEYKMAKKREANTDCSDTPIRDQGNTDCRETPIRDQGNTDTCSCEKMRRLAQSADFK